MHNPFHYVGGAVHAIGDIPRETWHGMRDLAGVFNRHTVKLGWHKDAHKDVPRGLPFEKYTAALPKAPETLSRSGAVKHWSALRNTIEGNCTWCGALHSIQLVSAINGCEWTPPEDSAEKLYVDVSHYDIHDRSTDKGENEKTVLDYWKQNGLYGHGLYGWATIKPGDFGSIRQAIWMFGTVYLGVDLPLTAENAPTWDFVPTAPPASILPGSWGGHCAVSSGDYTVDNLPVITWGVDMPVTPAFWRRYVAEVHVPLMADWIGGNGEAPCGFDLAALQADLAAMNLVKA